MEFSSSMARMLLGRGLHTDGFDHHQNSSASLRASSELANMAFDIITQNHGVMARL